MTRLLRITQLNVQAETVKEIPVPGAWVAAHASRTGGAVEAAVSVNIAVCLFRIHAADVIKKIRKGPSGSPFDPETDFFRNIPFQANAKGNA